MVPGVIFTLTCSVATASLPVLGVRNRVMQEHLFLELFRMVRDKDFHIEIIECPFKCFPFYFGTNYLIF